MGRTKKKKENNKPSFKSRAELEHRLCYSYAECKSYGAVGRKFGVHPEIVRRAWNKLSEEEQQSIIDTNKDVADNLNRKFRERIKESISDTTEYQPSVESLNRQTIHAERNVSDDFVINVMESRALLGKELRRRCSNPSELELMTDKNFATLFRLVTSITNENKEDEETAPQGQTLRKLRLQIEDEIYKHK